MNRIDFVISSNFLDKNKIYYLTFSKLLGASRYGIPRIAGKDKHMITKYIDDLVTVFLSCCMNVLVDATMISRLVSAYTAK